MRLAWNPVITSYIIYLRLCNENIYYENGKKYKESVLNCIISNLRAIPNNVSLCRRIWINRWTRGRTCRNSHFWKQTMKWSNTSKKSSLRSSIAAYNARTDTYCIDSFLYIHAHKCKYVDTNMQGNLRKTIPVLTTMKLLRSDYTPTTKCQISFDTIWIQRRHDNN